ncbi:MAG: glycosyltransferase, partial [Deltaproteobacteria bacterium]|nr:glycosyltransferase [Deltaproteobacteria bacterium]
MEFLKETEMADHITASMVLYENDETTVTRAVDSILRCPLVSQLYVVDNSPDAVNVPILSDPKVVYVHSKKNIGYGAAHNIAIRRVLEQSGTYHIVVNPDVYVEEHCLDILHGFMAENTDVGLVMPKVLYPDGATQHLCKLLPTP